MVHSHKLNKYDQCKGICYSKNKIGKRCNFKAVHKLKYCVYHLNQAVKGFNYETNYSDKKCLQ